MPELPEIFNLAKQFNTGLRGKKIIRIEVRQEKCLNVPVAVFQGLVLNRVFSEATPRGKWIFAKLEPDAYFLLSLGMGGDVLYHTNQDQIPDKYQLKFDFDDGSCLSIGFWWFGYAHVMKADELQTHKMTGSLGLSPFDESEYTFEKFNALLGRKKGNIKGVSSGVSGRKPLSRMWHHHPKD